MAYHERGISRQVFHRGANTPNYRCVWSRMSSQLCTDFLYGYYFGWN